MQSEDVMEALRLSCVILGRVRRWTKEIAAIQTMKCVISSKN
jgi:hypothetical protein